MKLFGRDFQGFAKALVVLATILLVSFGLCGLNWIISSHGGDAALTISIVTGLIELAAMALSSLGIVFVSLAWAGTALYSRYGKPPKDRVQKLFDEESDRESNDMR